MLLHWIYDASDRRGAWKAALGRLQNEDEKAMHVSIGPQIQRLADRLDRGVPLRFEAASGSTRNVSYQSNRELRQQEHSDGQKPSSLRNRETQGGRRGCSRILVIQLADAQCVGGQQLRL